MKPLWPTKRVGDLKAPVKHSLTGGPFGSNLVSHDYVSDGVPVIRGCNLPADTTFSFDDLVFVTEAKADSLLQNNAHPGDMIFTQRGTLGQVGLIPDDSPFPRFVISQSQMKLTVDPKKADKRFLYQYFRMGSTVEAIKAQAISSGVPHINLATLRKFEVLAPPVHTQRKIAAILTAYDDLIETNKRRIALLEKMAEETYREWFVRMRFSGYRDTKFVKGVPDGWLASNIGDLIASKEATLQTGPFGTYLKAEDYTDEGTPVINVRNIGDGRLRPDKLEFLPESKVLRLRQHVLESGDIVFGRKGAVERHLLVTEAQNGWVQGSDCIRLRLSRARISSRYLSLTFRQQGHKEWMLNQCSGGATMASLNERVLRRIAFWVPPIDIGMRFERVVKSVFQGVELLYSQNELLARTRDLLLPRLISGKLSVAELDIQFPPSICEEGKEPGRVS